MSVTIVLALSLVVADAPPPPSMFIDEMPEPYEVCERYYRIVDVTDLWVELGTLVVREAREPWIRASVSQGTTGRGRSGPGKGQFRMNFNTFPGRQVHRFPDDHTVRLRVDGEAIPLQDGEYDVHGSSPVRESITVCAMGENTLRLLSTAQRAEGAIGDVTFRLRPVQVAAIREFARYARDPKLAVKRSDPTNPGALPYPDRTLIPSGQAVVRGRKGGLAPIPVKLTLRAFDEIDELLANPKSNKPAEEWLAKERQQLERGAKVEVPTGTAARVLERLERPKSRMYPELVKIELLDGPRKGTIGWCRPIFVIASLKTAAERDAIEIEVYWRTAQSSERDGDPKNALISYRGIVKNFPSTTWAKQAAERIKALERRPGGR